MSERSAIRDALGHIDPNCDRAQWVQLGMAIKSEMGADGFFVWNEWSQAAKNYDKRDALDTWKSISETGGVTVGTLYFQARQAGWMPSKSAAEQGEQQNSKIASRQTATATVATSATDDVRTKAQTAQAALQLIQAAAPAAADHPYLVKKGVETAGLLELAADRVAHLLGYAPKCADELLAGRLLLAPVKRDDQICTLELIDERGRKAALAGKGTKVGGYWHPHALPQIDSENLVLFIGEGVATVQTVAAATRRPVVAALSSGNLLLTAQAMRRRYPQARLVILADLQKGSGQADEKAKAAARAISGYVVAPEFQKDRRPDQTDFNDMAQALGVGAVGDALARFSKPPTVEIEATGWGQAVPVSSCLEREEYPIDALPDLIRNAVLEAQAYVQSPTSLVALCALSAVSVACQGRFDVRRDAKLVGPTSLFMMGIADSGERKSTADKMFMQPIEDYQEEQRASMAAEVKRYRDKLEAWTAKRNGIRKAIETRTSKGNPTHELEAQLLQLGTEEPEKPLVPRLLYQDITPEALAEGLAKQYPSGAIVSAEGGAVFGSHGMNRDSVMRNLAQFNQLWDGGALTIDRKTSEPLRVAGARLTLSIQVQPKVIEEFLGKNPVARGSGFLARFLVAWPQSTQGSRLYREAGDTPALKSFQWRVSELLANPLPIKSGACSLEPSQLVLSTQAKEAWRRFYNTIEQQLGHGGQLHDVRDVASKAADNAARLAALFHQFEQLPGQEIGQDPMERACLIVGWHITEAARFMGEIALPQQDADAQLLEQWLLRHCQAKNVVAVSTREVRQYAHNRLRDGRRLNQALDRLAECNRAEVVMDGKSQMIRINPELLTWSSK